MIKAVLVLLILLMLWVGCINVNRGSQKVTNIYRLMDSQVTMYEEDNTDVAADKEYHDSLKVDLEE